MKISAAAPQNPMTVGMEGAGRNGGFAAHALRHTFFHLLRRIFSEGDGQDFFRPGVLVLNQECNALYQDRSFSGTRARQHQHRADGVLDGLLLLWIRDERFRHNDQRIITDRHYAK